MSTACIVDGSVRQTNICADKLLGMDKNCRSTNDTQCCYWKRYHEYLWNRQREEHMDDMDMDMDMAEISLGRVEG